VPPESLVPASFEVATIVPASLLPTTGPTLPPSDTSPPTKTPKPASANLVATKFDVDADYLIADQAADFILTLKNSGAADAGPFSAAVLEANEDTGAQAQSDPQTVDGLGAGKSIKVTFSLALPKAGHWSLLAKADSDDQIDESNENDNEQTVRTKVLTGLPDLVWADGGFSMTPNQTRPGYYTVQVDFKNTGTDELAQSPAFVGITWYRDEDGASGDLDPFPITDLAQGAEQTYESDRPFSEPGMYTVYALLDRDHVLNELSSDNNETSIRVTVP